MASQNDMFGDWEESQDIVEGAEGGENVEDDEGNTVEGVVIQERAANDYDKQTKKTVNWRDGKLSIVIDHMEDHYEHLVGHTKDNEYRQTRVNAWKRLLNEINNWNDVNGTQVIRSVKSIKIKMRNLRARSMSCIDVKWLFTIFFH